jgi:hypothetical protein
MCRASGARILYKRLPTTSSWATLLARLWRLEHEKPLAFELDEKFRPLRRKMTCDQEFVALLESAPSAMTITALHKIAKFRELNSLRLEFL